MFEIKGDPIFPEKGQCMFATRSISKGTVILRESPILIVNDDQEDLESSSIEFEKLSTQQQQSVLDLHHQSDGSINDILLTNAHKIDAHSRGLFLTLSRVNHACNPNSLWVFHLSTTIAFSVNVSQKTLPVLFVFT